MKQKTLRTSFKNQIRLNILCVASTTSFSHFFLGGGQGGQKNASLALCHLEKLVLLPFVAISVHSCWRDLRNKQEAGMLSSSTSPVQLVCYVSCCQFRTSDIEVYWRIGLLLGLIFLD